MDSLHRRVLARDAKNNSARQMEVTARDALTKRICIEQSPFSSKIRRAENGCLDWTGRPSSEGYGRITIDGRDFYAHRVVYEHFFGAIPDGFQIDHLCRNRRCVNPEHLEAVTARVNNLRSLSIAAHHAKQERCQRGHLKTPENTYIAPGKRSGICHACCLLRAARSNAKRRGTVR